MNIVVTKASTINTDAYMNTTLCDEMFINIPAKAGVMACADIENACVSCALGGVGVPAVKLSRAVEALEKSSGFMELNMQDAPALEYFMLKSLRIWSR